MDNESLMAKGLIQTSTDHLKLSMTRIVSCLTKLSDKEIWWKSNVQSNSCGILVNHLCGNVTQYIISGLGNKKDERIRDLEFQSSHEESAILIKKLQQTIEEACTILEHMDHVLLNKNHKVQGFEMTGIEIIVHVVEHFSYHTGQIALLTKFFKDIDLGFYSGIDLNETNN